MGAASAAIPSRRSGFSRDLERGQSRLKALPQKPLPQKPLLRVERRQQALVYRWR
jgi:hypothetical protein